MIRMGVSKRANVTTARLAQLSELGLNAVLAAQRRATFTDDGGRMSFYFPIPTRKRKWLCRLGLHKWIRPEVWAREMCERCGKVQPREPVVNKWLR